MNAIQTLFGLDITDFQETCIITPYLTHTMRLALGIKTMTKGAIYHCAQLPNATIIKSGVGDTLTGDCMLWLKDSSCKRIIFFGSAGLTQQHKDITIGSIVLLNQCAAQESFTQTLHELPASATVSTDSKLTQQLHTNFHLPLMNGLSIGSLYCEENYLPYFETNHIDLVDMECSAAIAAANFLNKPIACFLYITDIIGEKPFWEFLRAPERAEIKLATEKLADILLEI